MIGGPKDAEPQPASPTKKFMELVVKEWQYVIDLRKQGKVAAVYVYIEKPGGVVISNAESREALNELLITLPMDEHENFQITPLIAAERSLKRAKQGKTYGPAPT